MKTLFKPLLAALCLLALSAPAMAQFQQRAYAPQDLRGLSYYDQVRVISLEYEEQSGGRRIPDDQLRFYIDQINQSNWGFNQVKNDIAQSLSGSVGPGPGPGSGETIRCESTNNRTRSCPTPWQGRSRLVRQLSGSSCAEGRSWNSQSGQVTVWGGCRAEFAEDWAPGPVPSGAIRCESTDNRPRSCPTPWQGRTRLSRQLSKTACVENQTWNSQYGQVTVWGGCRGEFVEAWEPTPNPDDGRTIRCESTNNRTRTCETLWSGRSELIRQLSGSYCQEGRTWNSQNGQVTVWGGCRAEFGPARGDGGGWDGGPTVTCSSNNNRYTTCHWPPGQGEPRVLQQLSSEPCVRGRSWGMANRNTIWVSQGCRARFGR